MQQMKHFCALALVVAGLLVNSVAAGASTTPSPLPTPADAHPTVMQQAADKMATATPSANLSPEGADTASTAANGTQREVFGFALASSLSDPTVGYPSWDFSLLNTVAFFGLHISNGGNIVADSGLTVWNSSQLTNLLTAAHAHGTKVVLTIIKQDFASGTPDMCSSLSHRSTTVSKTVAEVVGKHVDGVNVDYEGLGGTCSNGQSARAMMTDFVHQLRSALPHGSYLSIDTYASSSKDSLGFFDIPHLNSYVDSFFVMAYDLEYSNYARAPTSCATFCLGPTAPLAGYYYNDTSTASQYKSVVAASKIILGVPYYGRKSCVASATANAVPTSAVAADTYLDASGESGAAAVQPGSYVTHRDAHDPSGQERWDTWYNTSLGCTRELYWDDTVSLGLKYDLVNRDGLRGVGIWNLNYGGGASELWAALHDHFAACATAAVTSDLASPQPRGSQVVFTARSTGCADPLYEYWIRYPDGTWVMTRTFAADATWTWSTAAYPLGTYTIHVWANQGGGNMGTWQAFGSATFTLTKPPPCATAALAPPSVSAGAGTTTTLTASSTGCASPRYEFWVQYPSGTWYLKQGWGGATFDWNTGGLAPGTYTVHGWANQAGDSTSKWEAYGTSTVTLTGCTGASVAPATSTGAVGAKIAFTAASSGCTTPVYEFWLRYPDGTWHLGRGFGANAWTWNSAGYPKGGYIVRVWANHQGASTKTWEAYGSATSTLT
jgi:spore germination protein YaaH